MRTWLAVAMGWIVLNAIMIQPGAAAAATLEIIDGYELIKPAEPLPEKPWHDRFIEEEVRTPAGQPNAGAAWSDYLVAAAMGNRLQTTMAGKPWEEWDGFFECATWAYLSPDSQFRGNEALLAMLQTWLDRQFETWQTKPADAKAAVTWQPNRINALAIGNYALPLLEIENCPVLKTKIGAERLANLRKIVLDNILFHSTPEAYNKLMADSDNYINLVFHSLAVYVHGWVLTGEKKYLLMAHRAVHTLGRDQLPNGMFPYRYRVYGGQHQEFEVMYYHNINLRGLYLYWWATGSKEAEAIFRKSVPYYPLNMEPPYFFNDGPAIWWKDAWRTFWPLEIAMVAAVTGDGENAKIANDMARNNISRDRYGLMLGAHAYQQMGLRQVKEQPVRNRYIVPDPDIRGLRLRFDGWASSFSASSFTYTRVSAMRVTDDLSRFSALHLARPYVRVADMASSYRIEPDYGTLGREGSFLAQVVTGRCAVAATRYAPALTSETWAETQTHAPWQMAEVWLLTDQGVVGLMDSTATAGSKARELCHQFRFIIPGDLDAVQAADDPGLFNCGDLRFRVWATDLPFRIRERMRQTAAGEHDRRNWQLALSDTDRSPEHVAQEPPSTGQAKPLLRLPETRDYPKDYRRYSLTEVSPRSTPGFAAVQVASRNGVLAFRARSGDEELLAMFNPGAVAADYAVSLLRAPRTVLVSGDVQPALPNGQAPSFTLSIPAGGVALVKW